MLSFASVSKRVFLRNYSYENVFHLRVDFQTNQTHSHRTGFARALVLKQRQKQTRKSPNNYLIPRSLAGRSDLRTGLTNTCSHTVYHFHSFIMPLIVWRGKVMGKDCGRRQWAAGCESTGCVSRRRRGEGWVENPSRLTGLRISF